MTRRKPTKKKAEAKYLTVLHRMRNYYYISRASLTFEEVQAVEAALRGGMITERKQLLMLKSFDFDVDLAEAIHED